MNKKYFLSAALVICGLSNGMAQDNKVNDFTTPLHLLQPDYDTPYGNLSTEKVKTSLDRVFKFLDESTPAKIIDSKTGKELKDYSKMDENTRLQQGSFRLGSYEWGVTYSGMMEVAKVTKDEKYFKYVNDRFKFLSDARPHFIKQLNDYGVIDPQMRQMLKPHALDDAGAMAASMIKFESGKPDFNLRGVIDNYMDYIMYKEYRLSDGTFARKRPQLNTLWLDDMYMGVPAVAQMGKLTGDAKYFNEATKQIKQFAQRMFVPEKGLFMHGWVESSDQHPAFFWGRANGWAILTMTEVLDILPQNHPDRPYILNLYKTHAKALASLQTKEGFWHQLLDKNDSYLETSATAIYTYCIARGINKGWLDPVAFGPVAYYGWNAVSTKINDKGHVEGTCVGTGMGFDPAFYYYRPVNVYAAHGYGPVLLAGAEVIQLLNNFNPRFNDSAIQFYKEEQKYPSPIFSVATRKNETAPGSTRKGSNPIVFLIGDSTVKNGTGEGDNDQWGWGSFFEQYFNTDKTTVENHALGGRSSRTFITEGLWESVYNEIKKGDYLLIQFGHNDGGPMNTGRARASLKGIGEDSETVIMASHGGPEQVFSFGHYLRTYIRQAKAKGVTPVVLSPTPRNVWKDGKMERMNETYAKWAKEVAAEEKVAYIDLNDLAAKKFETIGEAKSKTMYKDAAHTTKEGAIVNAEAVIEALKGLKNNSLNQLLKK
jgi:unsaturated rhamnogalacturonyl hydrolase